MNEADYGTSATLSVEQAFRVGWSYLIDTCRILVFGIV